MNGVHDMGGMQDMGPVVPEPNEPVFHETWEGRVFALRRAMGAWGKWNIDATRYAVEAVPAADYLALSYFERQLVAFVPMLVQAGFVTPSEIETGRPAPDAPRAAPALTVERAESLIATGIPTSRAAEVAPRFVAGQRVRARNMHPPGHTRLPRYTRGKLGTIQQDRGVFVFPDTNAHFRGENPQHLYSVRFTARELWGDDAPPRDAVYVDLWDDYLELA